MIFDSLMVVNSSAPTFSPMLFKVLGYDKQERCSVFIYATHSFAIPNDLVLSPSSDRDRFARFHVLLHVTIRLIEELAPTSEVKGN